MTVAELIAALQRAIAEQDAEGSRVEDMRVLVFEKGSDVGRELDIEAVEVFCDGRRNTSGRGSNVTGWALKF